MSSMTWKLGLRKGALGKNCQCYGPLKGFSLRLPSAFWTGRASISAIDHMAANLNPKHLKCVFQRGLGLRVQGVFSKGCHGLVSVYLRCGAPYLRSGEI